MIGNGKTKLRAAAAALALCLAMPAAAKKYAVGPDKTYKAPCAVSGLVHDGDTVEIDAGLYTGDVCGWSANNLLLRGTAAYAHLEAGGKNAQGKGLWVIQGKGVTVENIEFSGASVPDQNGAGIRWEGDNGTVRRCSFHDNEDGILGGGGSTSELLIEYSDFGHNGFGDGQSHNMYILPIASFTLRHCYTHQAKIGHTVKSRAQKNYILYNRITGEADGTESYEIDLPNGGLSFIIGNIIQQGPETDNSILVNYGAEGLQGARNELYVVHNTFVNDRGSGGTFVEIKTGTTVAKLLNNLFTGGGTLLSGKADTAGNVVTSNPGFVDRAHYDYRLTAGSPAIDRGKDPGAVDGVSLAPAFEYVHPHAAQPRASSGAPDAGAYEFGNPGAAVRPRTHGMILRPGNDPAAPRDASGRLTEGGSDWNVRFRQDGAVRN